jgi:catechol 1,2-dioxygenase
MIIERQEDVTPAVLEAMSKKDGRLQEVMSSLVVHLHAFAREVRLTDEEFKYGIDFLNRIGKATTDTHNEGFLFSDTIGFSTLVGLLHQGATETNPALLGPYWRLNSPHTENGASIVRSPTPGPELFASCRVVDPSGAPIAGVEVDVWHSSPVGLYENEDDAQADMNLRGKFTTDAEGRFSFRSVKPGPYPVPTNGPVTELLHAQGRHPNRSAHIHFLGFKPGYKTMITQLFFEDDCYLDSDVVFGVKRDLIGDCRAGSGAAPAPDVKGDWFTFAYTFVMESGDAELPRPPIE